MKLKIEIADDLPNEVIIRGSSMNDEIRQLEAAFSRAIGASETLGLSLGDTEYFIPLCDILFFETDGADKVTAHTAKSMYYSQKKLYELEKMLPRYFVRASKSCILDSGKVASITRTLTGSGEVSFFDSHKKTYVSRMYYKTLKEFIYETRIKP